MTDTIPPTTLTAGPTVYMAWADEDYSDWSGHRIYADLPTAKRHAELDYTAYMTAADAHVGVLSWRDCHGQLKLQDDGHVALVYIDEQVVWSAAAPKTAADVCNCGFPMAKHQPHAAGERFGRPLTVGEAIITLVPGAEGAGIKP